MEHYCYWVGNCIGIQNHRDYIMFVAYAWFSCLIVSSTMMYMAYQRGFSVMYTFKLEIAELAITSFLVLSLGWLLAFQIYLLR